MTERPPIIDAEFEVISPGRQAPLEYDQRPSAFRRLLVSLAYLTDTEKNPAVVYENWAAWRLIVLLLIQVALWITFVGVVLVMAWFANWIWVSLGPILGYRTP